MQQGNDDGIGAVGARTRHGGLHVLGVDPGLDGSVEERAFGDAVDPFPRGQRRRPPRKDVVRVGHLEARDFEDVFELAGGEQREFGTAPLKDRIHPDRGAMDETADGAGRAVEPAVKFDNPGHDLAARVVRSRQGLQGVQRAGLLVEDAEVGEGSSDINAQPEALNCLRILPPGLSGNSR